MACRCGGSTRTSLFENRTTERAGALNVFIPGGFEAHMPEIVAWYAAQATG